MYPNEATLLEVGRICIAAGRLDAALGAIWWHLAPDLTTPLKARTAPANKAREAISRLARERLEEPHASSLAGFIREVDAAQRQRNAVLHSNWLLRGEDSTRPVSEFLALGVDERLEYLTQWEREAKDSPGWRLQRSRELELSSPDGVDQLVDVERRLFAAERDAVSWHFKLASMRETGTPPGWRGPAEARQGPQPLPPGALTGRAAKTALEQFLSRMKGGAEGGT